MADLPIVIPNTAVAPKDYTLSGGQELQLKSVRALIDGTGAGTPFLPTLQLLDPNGHVMWEGASTNTVAAGGSADVSWFPGVSSAGDGIRFDTDNEGGWLDITTNNNDGTFGMNLVDKSGTGVSVEMLSSPFPEVSLTPTGALLAANTAGGAGDFSVAPGNGDDSVEIKGTGDAGITLSTTGTGNVIINSAGTRGVTVQDNPALTLGFLGATPVAQQATPVTLGDVITLLQAFGLSA